MPYEIDFLPVGDSNGDAICMRYGSTKTGFTIHVVDGGYSDTGTDIVKHINDYYGNPTVIHHVVLSHADRDHAAGLKTVIESFEIGVLWMNRPWMYCSEILDSFEADWTPERLQTRIRNKYPALAELEDLANARGIPIMEVFAGAKIGGFHVLAPTRERYLEIIPELDKTPVASEGMQKSLGEILAEAMKRAVRWVESWFDEKLDPNPPAVTPSNESSVVQIGVFDDRRVLLTADAGPIALAEAAQTAYYMDLLKPLWLFQIPHHGSRRNLTPSILDTWLGSPVNEGNVRGYAICSIGRNKTDYPRKRVSNACLRRGFNVCTTRKGIVSDTYRMHVSRNWPAAAVEPFAYDYVE
jgi:beta-lactamase superfamily II metal-dependent hydrolase